MELTSSRVAIMLKGRRYAGPYSRGSLNGWIKDVDELFGAKGYLPLYTADELSWELRGIKMDGTENGWTVYLKSRPDVKRRETKLADALGVLIVHGLVEGWPEFKHLSWETRMRVIERRYVDHNKTYEDIKYVASLDEAYQYIEDEVSKPWRRDFMENAAGSEHYEHKIIYKRYEAVTTQKLSGWSGSYTVNNLTQLEFVITEGGDE